MSLTFPQHITVHNARLKYFFYSLVLSFLAALLFRFLYQKPHLKNLDVEGDVLLWVSGYHDLDLLSKVWAEKSAEPFCSEPNQFDYWYNFDGATHFENHSCIPMCRAGQAQAGCLTQWETFMPESSSQVFLTTQFQEALLLPDGNETSGALSHYFVPVTEALSVSLTYSYRQPDLDWFKHDSFTSVDVSRTIDSRVNVTTIVVTSEKVENRTFQPGADISLTVQELLNLAGKSLDSIERSAGANRLEGAEHPEGALARISGMELLVDVECFQGLYRACGFSVDGPVCCLLVSSTWATWQSIAAHDALSEEGALRYRLYHGVRIKAKVGGFFKKVDPNSIYLYLCSVVVLMQFPKKLVLLVACTLLGHTSKIYRNVIFRKFSITKECGGMAMRLMGNNQAFTKLEDARRLETRGISRARIRRELKTLLTRRGCLDKAEIDQMVHFCHNATVQEREKTSPGLMDSAKDGSFRGYAKMLVHEASKELAKEVKQFKEVFGDTGSKEKEAVGADMPVDIDSFLVACSSAEPIDFESFVKLFDRDRRQFFFERFFMPPKLKNCLDKSREDTATTQSSESDEDDEEEYTDDFDDKDFDVTPTSERSSSRGENAFMTKSEGNSLMSNARRLKDQVDKNSLALGHIERQLAEAPTLTPAATAAPRSDFEAKLRSENAELTERITKLEELVRSYSSDPAANLATRAVPATPQPAFLASLPGRSSGSTSTATERVKPLDDNVRQAQSQLMQAFYGNLSSPMTSRASELERSTPLATRPASAVSSGAATPTRRKSKEVRFDLGESQPSEDAPRQSPPPPDTNPGSSASPGADEDNVMELAASPGALERRVMEQVWWLQNQQRGNDAALLREAMARVLALQLVPVGTGLEGAASASARATLGQVRSLAARLRRDGMEEGASNVEALAESMAESMTSRAAPVDVQAATTSLDIQADPATLTRPFPRLRV